MTEETRKALVTEMQALIEEVSKGAARLKEIQDMLLGSVEAPVAPKVTEKPMPKYFGPDPNFEGPKVPTPEKRMIDQHTLEWGQASRKF
jgi:hypothetical protein